MSFRCGKRVFQDVYVIFDTLCLVDKTVLALGLSGFFFLFFLFCFFKFYVKTKLFSKFYASFKNFLITVFSIPKNSSDFNITHITT